MALFHYALYCRFIFLFLLVVIKEAGHYAISRIGIFGSVARGEQTEESDVDVCIECPPMGLFRLGSMKNALEQLFGCRVDIVRLRDHMNAFLRERIEKEGIYV